MLRLSKLAIRSSSTAKKHNKTNVLGFLNFNENKQPEPEDLPNFQKLENSKALFEAYVKPILPKSKIPPMPEKDGITWKRPNFEKLENMDPPIPYNIKRGKFHTLEESITEEDFEVLPYDIMQVWRYPEEPIVRVTKISNVTGDYEKLVEDIETCLEDFYKLHGDEENFVQCQIHELDGCVYVKGHWGDVLLEYFGEVGF